MKPFYSILVSFLFLFIGSIDAQGNSKLDSLKLALRNAKHDTARCTILYAMTIAEGDETIWPIYNEELRVLAEKKLVGLSKGESLYAFYTKQLFLATDNIAYLAKIQSDYPKAILYYNKAIEIAKRINYKKGIGNDLNDLAQICEIQGDIKQALTYHERALKIREEIKDNWGTANSFNNIALILMNQGQPQQAIEYSQKSINIRDKNDFSGRANSINMIGSIFYQQGNTKKGLEYFLSALKMLEENNLSHFSGPCLMNIGSVYNKENNKSKTLEYYKKALDIFEINDEKLGIAQALNNYSTAFLKYGDLGNAEIIANRCLTMSKELGIAKTIKFSSLTLSQIYKKQNKHDEALAMYTQYIQMSDSINNESNKKASIKTQLKYEYEKKAAADSVRNAEGQKVKDAQLNAQNASLKQEKTQRYALYGGLVLVIGFLGFVYNRFRITNQQKKFIEEQKLLVDDAFQKLEEKNNEVMDSIYYARRIQRALITSEKYIERKLREIRSK